jgi:hypothetical protein
MVNPLWGHTRRLRENLAKAHISPLPRDAPVAPVTVPVAAARIVLAVGQGAGQQDWQEERDGPFNNVYEESKWMAEHLLGVRNIYLQPRGSFIQSRREKLLTRRIRFFVDYINTHKKFRRNLGEGPVVTLQDFADYVAASIEPGMLVRDDTFYGRNVTMPERDGTLRHCRNQILA